MNELVMHVIYGPNQIEHPGRFVVRDWFVDGNGKPSHANTCLLADSLVAARRLIPPGKVLMRRDEADDPAIVETWL